MKKLIIFLFCAIISLSFFPDVINAEDDLEFPNPLGKGVEDPNVLIANIIKQLMGVVGSIALIMFIYGGFMWMTAVGNEERVKKGRGILMWSTLGMIVVFSAYAIVNFVLKALIG